MATSFLRFYKAGNVDGMAFAVGASGVNCAAGVNCATGRVYIGSGEDAAGSGLSLGWAMALGCKFIGIG